jgi:cytochrome c oxidase subunit II
MHACNDRSFRRLLFFVAMSYAPVWWSMFTSAGKSRLCRDGAESAAVALTILFQELAMAMNFRVIKNIRIPTLIFVAALLSPSAFAQEPQEKPAERAPRIIQVTAKNFEFEPSVIHVKGGEKIQLKVMSVDKTHGLHISPFRDGGKPNTPPGLTFTYGDACLKLTKDMTATVEFIAQDPGTYSFLCCKKCGTGHGRMKGQIIVDP